MTNELRQLAESLLFGLMQVLIGHACIRAATGNPNWPALSPSKPRANQRKGVAKPRSAAEGS